MSTPPVSFRDILTSILVDLGISADTIVPSASLRQDLKLDSTETVEISLELRRRLGIDITLESKKELTVEGVCALMEAASAQPVR